MVEQNIDIERIEQLVNLFGNFDENIKRLENDYDVQVISHGSQLKVRGEAVSVSKAVRAINCLLVMLNHGEQLSNQNIDYVINMVEDGDERIEALRGLVAKYSPQYATEGDAAIARSAHRTAVVALDCESFSGKCKRVK